MFSPLARGVGTWTGDIHAHDDICPEDVLPLLPVDDEYHPHGITVSPRLYPATQKFQRSEKANGELVLPKTFITRKGALMLFTAPDDFDKLSEDDKLYVRKAHCILRKQYAEQIVKLGKLSRLAQSILIFGDENYSKEDASISDTDNKVTLKFLHDLDSNHCDEKSRPGSDLSSYLLGLRSRRNSTRSSFSCNEGRKSSQSFLTPSRETTTLSADSQSLICHLRPNSATDDRASTVSSSRSRHRVLSADKLRASIKSNSYLGRRSATPVVLDEERVPYPFTPPVSRRSSTTSITYKHTSTPLLEHQHKSKPNVHEIADDPGFVRTWSIGESAEQELSSAKSMSRSEHVQRYLEDIQSEGLREESITEGQSTGGGIVADDLEADHFEEYDDYELESCEEQSLDGTHIAAQPLMPLYANEQVEMISNDSLSKKEMDDENSADVSEDIHSVQDSAQAVEDLDDENDVLGVTAVDIINSHRSSIASSHSGFPSDGVQSDAIECTGEVSESRMQSAVDQHIQSAAGQRVQSARGQRVQSARVQRVKSAMGQRVKSARGQQKYSEREHSEEEEESPDVREDVPRAPPGTRAASPTTIQADEMAKQPMAESDTQENCMTGTDLARPSDFESKAAELEIDEFDKAQRNMTGFDSTRPDTGRFDTLTENDQETDNKDHHKSKSEKQTVGNDSVKQHISSAVDDDDGKAAGKDVNTLKSPDVICSKSSVTVEQTAAKSDNGFITPEAALLTKDTHQVNETNIRTDQIEIQEVREAASEPRAINAAKLKNTKETRKAKEKIKVKEASRIKEPSKEVSRIKEHTKTVDVTQIASEKSAPKKNEPLLKGLESYIVKTKKDSTKKTDKDKKSENLAELKHPASGPSLIPSPPSKSKEEMAIDQMEKEDIYNKWKRNPTHQLAVTEILSNKTMDTGFSAEEMEIEQRLLQERLEAAEQKVKGEPASPPPTRHSAGTKKGSTKKIKKGKEPKDDKAKEDLTKQREALREARRLEKMKRLEEAKQLEEQIKEKEEAKRKADAESERKAQALQEQIEMIAKEAAEARRLEEEAQQQMALQRKKAREEREARRKAELERKKREAAKHREHEKKMLEAAKLKEQEMLARIADAEHKHMVEEEEKRKREEEELLEEQQREAEEQELERLAEEEEATLRELERQAEEEALAFLVREREEAEARQRALLEQKAWEEHQRELQRKQIEEEKLKLEEEMRKQQEEEFKRFEEEKKRYEELQKIEQAALDRLRQEMEEKRIAALRRRELNLERRKHLSKLAHGQGLTRPWVFTYYVHWPKEIYEKRMGQDPKKKKGFRSSKKSKPKK